MVKISNSFIRGPKITPSMLPGLHKLTDHTKDSLGIGWEMSFNNRIILVLFPQCLTSAFSASGGQTVYNRNKHVLNLKVTDASTLGYYSIS